MRGAERWRGCICFDGRRRRRQAEPDPEPGPERRYGIADEREVNGEISEAMAHSEIAEGRTSKRTSNQRPPLGILASAARGALTAT